MTKVIKEERNERGQVTYRKYSDGSWEKHKYDEGGREIFQGFSDGSWRSWEYNENSKLTYCQDSDGYWQGWEYDKNGRETYSKNCKGYWEEHKYNEDGRLIHYENSTGYWVEYKYDERGREIYKEFSDGYWEKREYDDNDRVIYVKSSNGFVFDERESKEHFKDLNEKNENQEIAFLFDGTKIGERSQSFNDGYVIINARTKDEAVETFKAQYGRGQHNEALCTEVVSDSNRVEQIKNSDLPCHNYIDLTKPQEQNQSNTEEQTDGRK